LLVVIGARADGTKELLAVVDGERESEQCKRPARCRLDGAEV
jgi:transposase-like protein